MAKYSQTLTIRFKNGNVVQYNGDFQKDIEYIRKCFETGTLFSNEYMGIKFDEVASYLIEDIE